MTGSRPPEGKVVSFINQNSSDFRWINLFTVERRRIHLGRTYKRPQSHLPTGVIERYGLKKSDKRFMATFTYKSRRYYVGSFSDAIEAGHARQESIGHFKRTGKLLQFRKNNKEVVERRIA